MAVKVYKKNTAGRRKMSVDRLKKAPVGQKERSPSVIVVEELGGSIEMLTLG